MNTIDAPVSSTALHGEKTRDAKIVDVIVINGSEEEEEEEKEKGGEDAGAGQEKHKHDGRSNKRKYCGAADKSSEV